MSEITAELTLENYAEARPELAAAIQKAAAEQAPTSKLLSLSLSGQMIDAYARLAGTR